MEDGNKSGGGLTVAIIGAGVSGLAACKHCSEQGLNSTVFEGKSGLGGIWRASYSSTKLQTPKGAYAFSDFSWPDSAPTFPSHHQVVDYLESYARHFSFFDRIQFNSQIVEVKKKVKHERSNNKGTSKVSNHQWIGHVGGGELLESVIGNSNNNGPAGDWGNGNVIWEVCVRKKVPGSEDDYFEEWIAFDFLIMCCGRFGDIAKLPSFPVSQGPDVFDGQVLHALDYSALDSKTTQACVRGKKVVVVGFQKTSLDVAVEVAEINEGINDVQPCTLLFRRAHWMFPQHRKAFGLFSFGFLFGTRLSGYWTPKPGQGLLQSLLQTIFSPMRLLVWKLLEYFLRITVPVGQYGLVPEQSLFEDLSACVLPQVPQNLLGHLGEGRIVPKKTPHWKFYEKGVRLADGTDIEADVVILCTGYNGNAKLKAILPEEDKAIVFEPEGVLALYRGVIHPRIPNMGFIGYLEGLSSVHSAEISAVWLTQVLRRRVTLPDIATMETDRRTWLWHWKTTTPFFARTSACVATVQIWHTDKLCHDMGVKSLRKKTWWEELFSIYNNSDYRILTS